MSAQPALILASKSAARKTMLENAGLSFDALPSNVDEPVIVEKMLKDDFHAPGIALELARQKALDVSRKNPHALVIGSDQTLEFQGEFISKAENKEAARKKLALLRGEEHTLISAISVAYNGESLWQHIDDATLRMRNFDDEFLDRYCSKAGAALTQCVGAYEFEGLGGWLFSSIKGDFFTILGMPLLPLLGYLKDNHGFRP